MQVLTTIDASQGVAFGFSGVNIGNMGNTLLYAAADSLVRQCDVSYQSFPVQSPDGTFHDAKSRLFRYKLDEGCEVWAHDDAQNNGQVLNPSGDLVFYDLGPTYKQGWWYHPTVLDQQQGYISNGALSLTVCCLGFEHLGGQAYGIQVKKELIPPGKSVFFVIIC